METTVRVYGEREVIAAFRKIDTDLVKRFGNDLKLAAEPVVKGTKAKEKWRGASIGTIRAKRAGARVYVEQSAKKVTGKRGDFGALQMRQALIPALDENAAEVFAGVELVLDKYADHAGF